MTTAHATEDALTHDADGTSGGFDPADGVFVAQRSRPADLASVDVASLTPVQRSLLVIDGTVTKFLEAYMLEPVEVLRLEQGEVRLTRPDAWLELPAGAPVIRRRVMLRGRQTGRFFAWADSLIAIERLAPSFRLGLEKEGGGLGRILIDNAAETRRECLWYGREQRGGAPPQVSLCWPGDFVTRAYRVLEDGRPMMLITERFPL